MIKNTRSISINILSVLLILISVSICMIGQTNSWFTAETKNGIQIMVDVGELKLAVYQVDPTVDLKTYIPKEQDKINHDQDDTPKYISIKSGEIIPDETIKISLVLANNDTGAAAMYVKYKFELFKRGIEHDEKIDIIIDGYDLNTTANGFVQSGEWYYYQNSASQNVELGRGDQAVLMKSFKIPYSSFVDVETGELLIKNSDTLYVKMTIQASVNTSF